jgi:hypothetical protein
VLASSGETAWRLLPLPGRPPLTRFAYWVSAQECTIRIDKAREQLGYVPVKERASGLAELAAATEPEPRLGGMLPRRMADTIELPSEGWRTYFDELSRGLATTQATIEIDGPDLGAQVQAEGLVLSGISFDDRDDVLVIGLSPGGPAESLEHLVSSPQRISVESSDDILPSTIEVEDAEGQRTLVRLQAAPALPAE